MHMEMQTTFYEFFAGGGLASVFSPNWTCTFANDIDPGKGAAYAANWGKVGLIVGDNALARSPATRHR